MSKSRMACRPIRVLVAATMFSTVTFAAEPPPPAAEAAPSREMREKMAAAHESMAACLRSEKSFADCRNEMQRSCQQMHGGQGCPMMGMGMHERMKKQ